MIRQNIQLSLYVFLIGKKRKERRSKAKVNEKKKVLNKFSQYSGSILQHNKVLDKTLKSVNSPR